MSKLKFLSREPRKRTLFNNLELERRLLKSIVSNLTLSSKTRQLAQDKLSRLNKNSSITRINNRCIITARNRGIIRKFKLSRICFREFVVAGKIPGIKKQGNG